MLQLEHLLRLLLGLRHPLGDAQFLQSVARGGLPLLHHVERLAGLGLEAVGHAEVKVLEKLSFPCLPVAPLTAERELKRRAVSVHRGFRSRPPVLSVSSGPLSRLK